MTDGCQRYRCGNGHTKLIDKPPSEAPVTIRTGCDNCEKITRFLKMGSALSAEHTLRQRGLKPYKGGDAA